GFSDNLDAAFSIVRDTLPIQEAVLTLTRFARENQSATGSLNLDNAVNTLSGNLDRRKQGDEPITFSPEETEAITGFFGELQEMLPRIRTRGGAVSTYFVSAFNMLISKHRELSTIVSQELIQKIGKLPTDALLDQVSTYAPDLPVSQVNDVAIAGLDRIRAVSTGFERLTFITDALRGLSEDQMEPLILELNRFVSGESGVVRQKLLETIFTHHSSNRLNVGHILKQSGVEINQLPDLLNDRVIYNLISVMADNLEKHRFTLGTILSQITLSNIPQSVIDKLAPIMSNMEFAIKPENQNWYLCGMAEPRLRRSMEKGAVILINHVLLAKFDGKFSALCLQNITTKSGATFLAGNWYSPTDSASREALKTTFDAGNAKIDLTQGEWTIMRPLAEDHGKTPAEILEEAKKYAEKLPDTLPMEIDHMSRKRYRETEHENH
ncbi:MAG: hypothetical protein Q7R95_03030, partial [bacterium]|nr:hypothetical protein [bacterium]